MQVTADVVGEGERDLELAADATYADLLRACSLSPHEATVLVEGSPVPEDAPVAADRVEVLRLVKGGQPLPRDGPPGRTRTTDKRAVPVRRRLDTDAQALKPLEPGPDAMSHTQDTHELVGEPAPAVEAPNVGAGPDRFSLDAVGGGTDAVVIVLMRDYYCTKCQAQADRLADRYEAFRERDAEVVAVLPEAPDRARDWADVPYPLLADPEKDVAEEYDQPTRYGILGDLSDLAGRMPEAVVVDTTGAPEIAYVHRGDGINDRPTEDELLSVVAGIGGET